MKIGHDPLPDPEEAVDLSAKEEGEYGIFRDQMADGTAEAHSDSRLLQDMYVNLDAILDDTGLYPAAVHQRGREAQRLIEELMNWTDEYRAAMKEQAEEASEISGD